MTGLDASAAYAASVAATATTGGRVRSRVTVRGVVQGVGFRPFVHALATELSLAGRVANTEHGVVAEVEGDADAVAGFCQRVARDAPPLAVVDAVEREPMSVGDAVGFHIDHSRAGAGVHTLVPPDVATCAACLAELCDPADRRHRHPFITCTHCGPRLTLITGLPYDRRNTTMARFTMCERCAHEYADPLDRRFHAQPVACHDCGPQPALWRRCPEGTLRGADGDPIEAARELLRRGEIVAVKGLGGYHLACDATNTHSVRLLRARKSRGDKPFAVMARDLSDVTPLVRVTAAEHDLLTGPRRPIVLLRGRPDSEHPDSEHPDSERPPGRRPADVTPLADEVAPRSADLGVMLPYTPLHHLLLGLPGDPPGPRLLVMTSGNRGGEPIVTDDGEAFERLAPLADAWLTHDRPIQVPCDDSVVRVVDGAPLLVRRSRGYAPTPISLPVSLAPALAVGGDLKNTFCLGEGRRAWPSAHVGDMDDLATLTAFPAAEAALESVTGVVPRLLAADRHPAYRSSAWARRHAAGRPVRTVQHHHAHVASAMAEAGETGERPVIGVAFDGTGYGDDGAVWGGEFLLADYDGYRRFARLTYTRLPGGDAAVRHPWRMALSHLSAAGIDWGPDLPPVAAGSAAERSVLEGQLRRGLGCVPTSSMGRLFDAVSSLVGLCHHAGYEAQAALELEAAASTHRAEAGSGSGARAGAGARADSEVTRPRGRCGGFALSPDAHGVLVADPAPVLSEAVAALRRGDPPGGIAACFHTAVAGLVRHVCGAARERHGLETVALSGGVFTNALLSAACARGLREDGFTVLTHRLVPPNDGGLALGQLVVAARAWDAPTDAGGETRP